MNNNLVDNFLNFLENDKKLSNNTLQSYNRDIKLYGNYLDAHNMNAIEGTENSIKEYFTELKSEGKADSTISRNLASLRSFYQYLYKNKIVSEDPTSHIESPKITRKPPKILSTEQVELLLNQPKCVDLKGYRDKAMLELVYATGIRVTELISLRVEDVNLNGGYIKVKKKNTERHIPLGNLSLKCLKEYMNKVRPLLIRTEEEKTLFINTNGQKMTRQGYWKILKQYKDQAKIDKDITPHTIRHSFAVHMLEDGAELKTVQELLGHTDVASTMMYTQMATHDINSNDINL